MNKVEARNFFRKQRSALTTYQVNRGQDLILIHFQQLSLPYVQFLHAYLPVYSNNEPDPTPLIDWLKFSNPGLQVVYPKINPQDYSMQHILEDSNTCFEKNIYGILEPVEGTVIDPIDLDIIMIPMLGFDSLGNRVGYGKGYYDRFLANCKKDVIKVGLSFLSPIDCIADVDFFDKKLDFCITPERVYAF